MTLQYAIADVASLVGEPTRAAILLALLDGRALPAGELAAEARITASATSSHLAKLTRGGLLAVHQEGRHRYYRLASEDVAHALEALGVLSTPRPPVRALSPERAALREARTCYDHLAGVIAVALADKLARERLVREAGSRAYEVTTEGERWFADVLRVDVAMVARGRRQFARRCLDWTERRPHVAGALGAAMLEQMLAMKWIAKMAGTRRVRITARGEESLANLGVRAPVSRG